MSGFKSLNKMNEKKKEQVEEFLNSARGDDTVIASTTEAPKAKKSKKTNKSEKREKTFLLYFTESEFDEVTEKASNFGMSINQYIRFKIFIANKVE